MSMVGRRGLLKSLGLAPLARGGKHKHRETPVGWNNQNVFAQLVIIYGSGTLGVFEYEGQPADGNPPIFWAVPPDVTEDPSGNPLVVSGGAAVATYSGGIAQHGAWLNPNTGSVQAIVDGAAEVWHTPSLSPGFTSVGSPYAPVAYQYEPVGDGRVRLRGQVGLTSNQGAGTPMFSVGVFYRPAHRQDFVTVNALTGYTAGSASVIVQAAGTIELGGTGGNLGDTVNLDGIVIELG